MESQNNACSKVEKVVVKNSSSKFYKANLENDDTYKITGDKKGLVLILNNSFKDAKGAITDPEPDVENMKELWTQMGCALYEEKAHEQKTAEEMKNLIKEMKDVGGYCFLVIIIMSHGARNRPDCLYGSDGETVDINEVVKSVNNKNSDPDIPKFFIFQTCRCGGVHGGVPVLDNYGSSKSMNPDSLPPYGLAFKPCITTKLNIILAYYAMDGYAAQSSRTEGSWFINAITNVFMKHAHVEHVSDLLVRVNHNVYRMTEKYKDDKTCKTMSQHVSYLTKRFFLFPGHPE